MPLDPPDAPSRRLPPIDTLFLDAGNTLVSIDWERVASTLDALGCAVPAAQLARAEAAARPALSKWIEGRSSETLDTFTAYTRLLLERLPPGFVAPDRVDELARELTARLKQPGRADRLWCVPLPGVLSTLEQLGARGIARVVVSNSDGSVERSLVKAGLRGQIDHVVDSHLVGAEKPDPAIFEHALELCGADRERTLHVGDMHSADVVGARAAGIEALLLDPHGDWGPVDCPTAPDLAALLDLPTVSARLARN